MSRHACVAQGGDINWNGIFLHYLHQSMDLNIHSVGVASASDSET